MRPLSLLSVSAALLLAAAAPALAQVAAPRLTPSQGALPSRYNLVHVTSLDISNPAATIWSGSAISAGAILGGDVFGLPGLSGSYAGGTARLLLVGTNVAFGISQVDSQLDWNQFGVNQTFESSDLQVELGLRFADWLALGVGRQALTTDFFDVGVPDEDVRRRDLPLAGVSLRFWDDFYLGLASGTDTVRIESYAGPSGVIGNTDSGERSVSRWGLGYLTRSPGLAVHVEYYEERRKPFDLPLVFPSDFKDDANLSGVTLEVVWANVLFAAESIDQDIVNVLALIPTPHSAHSTRISLGWVPKGQMGLVLTRTMDSVDEGFQVTEFNGTSMNAVWRW